MKKVLAVSGGVDSVVMLHLYRNDDDVIVAHFDHGIRENSADDAIFVEKLAKKYGRSCIIEHAKLGEDCSEENARNARYNFLSKLAASKGGRIYTAHHADDLVESVSINILRGTGWRGLAALSNSQIERPLIDWRKKDIYNYAAEHNLSFRLDQTNSDDKYLRNRVRDKLANASADNKESVLHYANSQRQLAKEIDAVLRDILSKFDNGFYPRTLMNGDNLVAIELLRAVLMQCNITQTRPQLLRAVDAIRYYHTNKKFPLNKKYQLLMGKYNFRIVSANCDES